MEGGKGGDGINDVDKSDVCVDCGGRISGCIDCGDCSVGSGGGGKDVNDGDGGNGGGDGGGDNGNGGSGDGGGGDGDKDESNDIDCCGGGDNGVDCICEKVDDPDNDNGRVCDGGDWAIGDPSFCISDDEEYMLVRFNFIFLSSLSLDDSAGRYDLDDEILNITGEELE